MFKNEKMCAEMNISGIERLELDAIIFDCDGTLVDTLPLYHRAYDRAVQAFGVNMTEDWYRQRAGMSESALLDAIEAEFGVNLDRHEIVSRMRTGFVERLTELREITAVAAIARAWRGRVALAVASGGPRAIVMASLNATGLTSLFDTIVTAEEVARPKPAPDLFLEAARRLAATPERCLILEDSTEGLEAARRAGMHAIEVASLTSGV